MIVESLLYAFHNASVGTLDFTIPLRVRNGRECLRYLKFREPGL